MGLSGAARTAAADSEPALSLSKLETHGFVSQGYIRTTDNNYLARSASSHGSFEFTEMGINFTQPLGEHLRAGIQLFARDLGPLGNYDIKADWFYLDYRWTDALGLRAGRIKIPFGLYNEVNDIDSARVPILLPQSLYPIVNRNLLLAQTGAELYGYLGMDIAGGLEYRFYGGTLYADPPVLPAGAVLNKYKVPYLFGGRVMW